MSGPAQVTWTAYGNSGFQRVMHLRTRKSDRTRGPYFSLDGWTGEGQIYRGSTVIANFSFSFTTYGDPTVADTAVVALDAATVSQLPNEADFYVTFTNASGKKVTYFTGRFIHEMP